MLERARKLTEIGERLSGREMQIDPIVGRHIFVGGQCLYRGEKRIARSEVLCLGEVEIERGTPRRVLDRGLEGLPRLVDAAEHGQRAAPA